MPLLGINLEKTIIQKDRCTPKLTQHYLFTAALFTMAKPWKQPKYLTTKRRIKKMWFVCVCMCVYIFKYVCVSACVYVHVYTIKYYSAIKETK